MPDRAATGRIEMRPDGLDPDTVVLIGPAPAWTADKLLQAARDYQAWWAEIGAGIRLGEGVVRFDPHAAELGAWVLTAPLIRVGERGGPSHHG